MENRIIKGDVMQVVVKEKKLMENIQELVGEDWKLCFAYLEDMVEFMSHPKAYKEHTGEMVIDNYATAHFPEKEIVNKLDGFEKWFIEGNNPEHIKSFGHMYQGDGKKYFLIHKDAVLKTMPLHLDLHEMNDKAWNDVVSNGVVINTKIEPIYNEFLTNRNRWPNSNYRSIETYYQKNDLESLKKLFENKPESLLYLMVNNTIYFEKEALQELVDWKGVKLFSENKDSVIWNDISAYDVFLKLYNFVVVKEKFIKNLYGLLNKEDKLRAENDFDFLNSTLVSANDINNVLDENVFEISLDLGSLKNLYNQNIVLKIIKNLNTINECLLDYFGYELVNSVQISNNSKSRHYLEAQPKNVQLPELTRKVFVQHFSEVCEYLVNNELRDESNKDLVKIGVTNWLEEKAMREQLESAGVIAKSGKKSGPIKF